jgi:hypothetical protein
MESKGCGVLDTPLSRSMTAYYGAVRRIHFAGASVLPLSAYEPRPKRRIGKRQFPAAAQRLEQLHEIERHVGRGPRGEKSLEGVEIRVIIRTVSRIIFGRLRRRVSVRSGGGRAQPWEIQR